MVFNFYGASSLQYTVLSAQTDGFTKKGVSTWLIFQIDLGTVPVYTLQYIHCKKLHKKIKSSFLFESNLFNPNGID